MACGLYILELIDSFTMENTSNLPLFDLSVDILNQLSKSGNNETALRYFELQLFHYLGYRPELYRCTSCNSHLKPVTNFFSLRQGGILCPLCNSKISHFEQTEATLLQPSSPISVNALKVLRLWQNCDYVTARRVKIKPELSSELRRVLQSYIRYILQREIKSMAWLERLKEDYSIDNNYPRN